MPRPIPPMLPIPTGNPGTGPRVAVNGQVVVIHPDTGFTAEQVRSLVDEINRNALDCPAAPMRAPLNPRLAAIDASPPRLRGHLITFLFIAAAALIALALYLRNRPMPTEAPPTPLTSTNTDLRDFGFMPLDVVRLRDSDLAMAEDAEIFRIAVISWCVSWHQVPAASLPDDDPTLARLLGFGRDLKGWKKLRDAGGLRGWLKCADGRLYHPVVAEKAVEAWEAKLAQRARTEAARAAAAAKRQHEQQRLSQTSVTERVASSKGEVRDRDREGTGKGQGEKTPAPPPGAGGSPGDDPTAATAALGRRVDAVDRRRVRTALAHGDLLELVAAFGANIDGDRAVEWPRDCDGMQLGVVAVIFAWRRAERLPIREPSGFRPWREAFLAMPLEERRGMNALLADYGIDAPGASS